MYVARQPIFDRRQYVFGYELLYRSGLNYIAPEINGAESAAEVIVNSMVTIPGSGSRAPICF